MDAGADAGATAYALNKPFQANPGITEQAHLESLPPHVTPVQGGLGHAMPGIFQRPPMQGGVIGKDTCHLF